MQTLTAWATVVLAAVAMLAFFAARGQIKRLGNFARHRALPVTGLLVPSGSLAP